MPAPTYAMRTSFKMFLYCSFSKQELVLIEHLTGEAEALRRLGGTNLTTL
jgi:hypothetical protein